MAKIKYRFDPYTLTYKKIKTSHKKKFVNVLSFFFVTIVTAIILHVVVTSYYDTPEVKNLKEEQEQLAWKFEVLQGQLKDLNAQLKTIERRDDNLYRPIFELEPIPDNVRDAGTGGAVKYKDFEKLPHSEELIETATFLSDIRKRIYIQSKSFDSVAVMAKNKEKMNSCIPAIQPIAINDFGRISDYYGKRRDPFTGRIRMHYGMDFTGPVGTDIYATGDGTVVKATYSNFGYGREVVINHGFGYKTIYAHLRNMKVSKGDKVKRGDVIGTLGNTGRSTGPHLHYEVRRNNRPVNPLYYYFNDITADEYDEMIAVASKSRKPMD
jgi:murein DD-endopeptidase MepM/ murein hydrolase activator NlpD